MLIDVKERFRLVKYRSLGGMFYLHDKETGERFSLETKDRGRATGLLVAKNEATREPAFNLQKARIYMAASDPEVATRTWGTALASLIASKPEGSENRARLDRFSKEKALEPILNVVLMESRPDQVLRVLTAGCQINSYHQVAPGLPTEVLGIDFGRIQGFRGDRTGRNPQKTEGI